MTVIWSISFCKCVAFVVVSLLYILFIFLMIVFAIIFTLTFTKCHYSLLPILYYSFMFISPIVDLFLYWLTLISEMSFISSLALETNAWMNHFSIFNSASSLHWCNADSAFLDLIGSRLFRHDISFLAWYIYILYSPLFSFAVGSA